MNIKKFLRLLYYIIINIIIIIIVSVTLILCYCFYCVLFCMYLSAYNNNIITIILYTCAPKHSRRTEKESKYTLLSLSALNTDLIFRPTDLRRLI